MGTTQSSEAHPAGANSSKKAPPSSSVGKGGHNKNEQFEKHNNHAPHGLEGSVVSEHTDSHKDFELDEPLPEKIKCEIDISHLETGTCDAVHTDDASSIDDLSDYESSESSEEDDWEWEERLRILDDARMLKQMATFFLHPELPVKSVFGSRCFFDRPSAPLRLSKEEADEEAAIQQDLKDLKQLASQYLHPELTVTSIPTACARNYFSRPSAPVFETLEDAEERAQILADARALKQLAIDYMHPELPVVSDPTAFGRNYFSRASAPEYEEDEFDAERDMILEDMKEMKKLAIDYMHPELPVVSTLCGRNYFSRASAPVMEDAEERERILEDMRAMKKLAVDYMHPELPVVSDPAAYGRNYFSRASAPEYEEDEFDAERDMILEDMKEMKKLAIDYMHPELPVASDSAACGRNYFSRASAPELEDAEEREQILEDMKAMKKLAIDYMHPELPVVSDPAAYGRNYFSRASAPEYEEDDFDAERDMILEDMKEMKKLAIDYRHPELPVVSDSAACGRNYFSRASAPQVEDAEEREQILEDMKAMKKLAVDYMHPELPVITEASACGRNYFSRASAPEYEEDDFDAERDMILEDMKLLKQSAIDYLHPELPVVSDPTAYARSYFSRPSAPEQESLTDASVRVQVMQDMKVLKQLAVDYLHPEIPIAKADPIAFARNFFLRPSAQKQDEDAEERARILEDMKAMKKLAVDYLHPELPVVTDPNAFGRNYFTRASAPEYEEEEVDVERDEILEDMKALKQLAVDYRHPELPVVARDPALYGRNYFSRASAPDMEDAEERDQILEDMKVMKKFAVDYKHPELPVVASDPTLYGRNYFARASAPAEDDAEECARIKQEMAEMKQLAVDYLHPELPVKTSDPTACGRNYFTRPSAYA